MHDLRPINKNKMITCQECGLEFKPVKNQRKFCSRKCRGQSQKSPLRKAIEAEDAALILQRIKDNTVEDENGCWVWQGSLNLSGYPTISGLAKGRSYLAHRVALESFLGESIVGYHAHHKCANKKCVRYSHLSKSTAAENSAEMLARKDYETEIRILKEENVALTARLEKAESLLDKHNISLVD